MLSATDYLANKEVESIALHAVFVFDREAWLPRSVCDWVALAIPNMQASVTAPNVSIARGELGNHTKNK